MLSPPQVAAADLDGLAFLRARLENTLGTYRRMHLHWFKSDYILRQAARRQGDCNRCGLCCQLVFKCQHLRFEDGLASCGRYANRPPNCVNFPINQADLDDVRRIAPHAACSFSFPPAHAGET
jgi:hypothetical protein